MGQEKWEKKQREAVNLLNTIVRSSELNGKIELQQFLIAFSQILNQSGPKKNLQLQPLYAYLKEHCRASPRVIDHSLIFLEFRLASLGIQAIVPTHLQLFTQEQKNTVLAEWQGGNSTAFEREKTPTQGTALKAPETATPNYKSAQKNKHKAKKGAIAIGALLILGFGIAGIQMNLSSQAHSPPSLKELKITPIADGFTCLRADGAPPTLMCKITDQQWQSLSEAQREIRAENTLRALASKGYKTLMVVNQKTGRIEMRFSP